jgi:hypothetical protein
LPNAFGQYIRFSAITAYMLYKHNIFIIFVQKLFLLHYIKHCYTLL